LTIDSSAKKPDVKRLDAKIMKMWNSGKDAKEIMAKLGLTSLWRIYNTRKRCPKMRRVREA
jgi:hypothetical protein